MDRKKACLRFWSDSRQTSQQDVSEGFGVANAIEASEMHSPWRMEDVLGKPLGRRG